MLFFHRLFAGGLSGQVVEAALAVAVDGFQVDDMGPFGQLIGVEEQAGAATQEAIAIRIPVQVVDFTIFQVITRAFEQNALTAHIVATQVVGEDDCHRQFVRHREGVGFGKGGKEAVVGADAHPCRGRTGEVGAVEDQRGVGPVERQFTPGGAVVGAVIDVVGQFAAQGRGHRALIGVAGRPGDGEGAALDHFFPNGTEQGDGGRSAGSNALGQFIVAVQQDDTGQGGGPGRN